jgi:hypothetical protein
MVQYTVQVDDAVAESIREFSQRRKVSNEQYVTQVLSAHHEEFRRFPDGVLREGRQKLIALLSQIPSLKNFDSSGVDFRYWWVSFEMDIDSPIAWKIVRKLGLYLNTMSAEMLLPTVFKPIPGEWPDDPMRWEIVSTAPRLNPTDVASWLSIKLPSPLGEESSWLK